MKKNHLLLFILLLGNLGLKAQETIDNPPYKFRNTALYRIEKVECTDQDTKIYLRTEFIPGWWVQFSKEEINLKDNLGNPLGLNVFRSIVFPCKNYKDSKFLIFRHRYHR